MHVRMYLSTSRACGEGWQLGWAVPPHDLPRTSTHCPTQCLKSQGICEDVPLHVISTLERVAAGVCGSEQECLGAQRTATSSYTTAASATPDDLQCQICLGTLRACVALDP